MDLFISPFSAIATKIVLLEFYANKKQIKRAFDDTEAQVSVFLHKTCYYCIKHVMCIHY